jgi:hypothetical protein
MRLWIFALSLCAATVAFCQSSAQVPVNPDKVDQLSPAFHWPGTDFSKMPPRWQTSSVSAPPMISLQNTGPTRRQDNAQIDPRMVIHPPKSSLGTLPPGTMVAQNVYPGLQLLPIEISSAKGQPSPIVWPNLKLQSIPIVSPMLKSLPVLSQAPVTNSDSLN